MAQPSAQDEKLLLTKHHYTLWQIIKLYWQSSERRSAYLAVVVVLVMSIFMVGVDVVFNIWYNFFYNALQAYNLQETVRLLGLFCVLATINIILAVYRYYISQLFGLRWRRWLTDQFIARWLKKHGYYYLENFDEKTDNPDQRIQEDIGQLVINTIALTIGIVTAITTFFAFIYILWVLSGVLTIPLGPLGSITIHGYLVWVGLFYSFVGTWLTFKIGRPLVGLNFEQQRREATFRYAGIDLRQHSEHVALYKGEHHQQHILQRLLSRALENYNLIIVRQKLLLWFTAGFNQVAVLLPLVVALPNYFGKVFLLGGLIQTLQAFRNVQDSLSYLINSFTTIAEWRAMGQRLTTFVNHLDDVEERAQAADHLTFKKQTQDNIVTQDVTVETPRKEILFANVNETFQHGQHYLIKGESGIGKSTFIRTIAGIWPFAAGEIVLPEKQNIMYVPQKPYMPLGTLAEAILFPIDHHEDMNKDLEKVLKLCRLEQFIPRLHEVATWTEQMSPGEQQRVAFARILLHKPRWAFLDESTSMLDVANEKYLYETLRRELPHCSLVSIGHRPTLDEYHDHVIQMAKYRPSTPTYASS